VRLRPFYKRNWQRKMSAKQVNTWVGEIFRHKTHKDLFIIVYHGLNVIVYKRFELTAKGEVNIEDTDMPCATNNWFETKEATGLRYDE